MSVLQRYRIVEKLSIHISNPPTSSTPSEILFSKCTHALKHPSNKIPKTLASVSGCQSLNVPLLYHSHLHFTFLHRQPSLTSLHLTHPYSLPPPPNQNGRTTSSIPISRATIFISLIFRPPHFHRSSQTSHPSETPDWRQAENHPCFRAISFPLESGGYRDYSIPGEIQCRRENR